MRNLSGLHVLLTYGCTSACDHCFVYSSPRSDYVFTITQLREIIAQAQEVPSIKTFYFEGGEPFLYYAHLLESVRLVRRAGYECGIVSNSYWASSVEDAECYLRPLAQLGIADLSISDDEFHRDPATTENRAQNACRAAENLGMPVSTICVTPPRAAADEGRGGEPVVGGDVMFKGRAVDTLVGDLPTQPAASFASCEQEDFREVSRVHIDPFGWVHLCQGVVAGNLFEKSLKNIIVDYEPDGDPIIGPLARGGPVELAKKHSVDVGESFVDACHMCFLIRRVLIDRFPDRLAPPRVYGLTEDARQ